MWPLELNPLFGLFLRHDWLLLSLRGDGEEGGALPYLN